MEENEFIIVIPERVVVSTGQVLPKKTIVIKSNEEGNDMRQLDEVEMTLFLKPMQELYNERSKLLKQEAALTCIINRKKKFNRYIEAQKKAL